MLTAEDPVEYDIDGIMQVAINEAMGMTFGKALRSFLRQDPISWVVNAGSRDSADCIQSVTYRSLVLQHSHTNDAPVRGHRLVRHGWNRSDFFDADGCAGQRWSAPSARNAGLPLNHRDATSPF
jgi:type II secretory ATPase GspE/PulE/Tfp pilus assembly ATPase PilB-like protein